MLLVFLQVDYDSWFSSTCLLNTFPGSRHDIFSHYRKCNDFELKGKFNIRTEWSMFKFWSNWTKGSPGPHNITR